MAALTAFARHLRISAPTCPEPIILDLVLRAAILFCRQSGIARLRDTLSTADGTYLYNLNTLLAALPSGYRVVNIRTVSLNGVELIPSSRDGAMLTDTTVKSQPSHYTMDSDGVLRLTPTPDGVYSLVVDAAITPGRTSTTVPDVLENEWFDGVLNLARYYMFDMPGAAWFNPQLAAVYNQLGLKEAQDARVMNETGRTKLGLAVRARSFA